MARDKVIKVQNLNDQIEYMRDLITDLLRDQEIDHEEYDEDLPFPTLTL